MCGQTFAGVGHRNIDDSFLDAAKHQVEQMRVSVSVDEDNAIGVLPTATRRNRQGPFERCHRKRRGRIRKTDPLVANADALAPTILTNVDYKIKVREETFGS